MAAKDKHSPEPTEAIPEQNELLELSRNIVVEDISGNSFSLEIEANETERKALAERFDLISMDRFTAHLELVRSSSSDYLHVDGSFEAAVVQRCVVTLEPVAAEVKGAYECNYSSNIQPEDIEIIEFDSATEDPPEPIINGEVDVGIMLTEQFGLELNPFPRSPNADFEELKAAAGDKLDDSESNNPFAVLKKLK